MVERVIRFVSQNTGMIFSKNNPGRQRRWAEWLDSNFDLAALQEVWTDKVADRLVRNLDERPIVHSRNGKTMLRSSGLVTLSWQNDIATRRFEAFNRQANVDRLGRKGVALTELALGTRGAVLQLYNTHLQARSSVRDIDNVAVGRLVTLRQLFEMAKWVVATRRPEMPAVICGDFNLDGEMIEPIDIDLITGERRLPRDRGRRGLKARFWNSVANDQGPILEASLRQEVPRDYLRSRTFGPEVVSKTLYQIIVDVMRVLGFTDAWGEDSSNRCYTTKLGRRDADSENDFRIRIGVMAAEDPASSGLFAVDSPAIAPNAARLDYVFYAPGDGSGGCVMRPPELRRTFIPDPRDAALPVFRRRWLSDHVGLAANLRFAD